MMRFQTLEENNDPLERKAILPNVGFVERKEEGTKLNTM